MNNYDEIFSEYNEYMSKLDKDFPLSENIIKAEHKKIKSEILSKLNISSFPSNVEKKINLEYLNYLNQNDSAYASKLNIYLSEEYNQIKENIQNNKYENIDDYFNDIKNFEKKIFEKNSAPEQEGPNKILHINEFIYEQILEDCEIIINNNIINYDNQFDKNKKELDDINNEINEIYDECQKILMKIKEKENIIKQIELDKKIVIKQATSNTNKISNSIKIKSDMINKLNQEIENVENKHDLLIQELKDKIKSAENLKLEKEKNNTEEKAKFESKKVELMTKIDFLEKQIKNINEARTRAIKSLTKDLLNSGQNSELKKFEEQISILNKKIQKFISKNNELSKELTEKEKIYENEKNKSKYLIEEYEKKLKSVQEDHDYIENKSNEIQNEENENMEQLKNNYESQIAELKSNFSKDELIIKSNIDKYTNLIEKTNDELSLLKNEYNDSINKLNDLKEKNNKDKNDQSNYIQILEENNKRIMSQYEESVKENNNLKATQTNEILRLNSETEQKIVSFSKNNENLINHIQRKKSENSEIIKNLQKKLSNLESQIPLLEKEQKNLENEINGINSENECLKKKNEDEILNIKQNHEKEIEELKKQCMEDLENNKIELSNNLEFASKECEQQKEELLQKMEENKEFNKQHQEELLNMYNEKMKILEQVKDEKIEDLTIEINECEREYNEYIKKTEEEMKETEIEIDRLDVELNDSNKILSMIQIEHEKKMKSNKENFKKEKKNLEEILYELLQRYNKTNINISLSQKINDDLNNNINDINEKIITVKNRIDDVKSQKENTLNELEQEIKKLNLKLINEQNNFNEKMALEEQEMEYCTNEIDANQKELNEFKNTFEEKITQCKDILINDFTKKLNDISNEKKELENIYEKKKSEFQSLQQSYHNQILLLSREKEVLTEKLKNVNVQIEEVESNLKFDKDNNYIEIESIKQENNDKINQFVKENEALRMKLSQVREDYNEMNEVYETDKALWSNKYQHLLADKNTLQNEYLTFKNKYNSNIDDLNKKLQNDRITLQQIYNEAIKKRDEKFNTQINNANKYFGQKFEYINNLNQELTLKNNELINTLNIYENQQNKGKETQLEVILHSIQRYKKEIKDLYNSKDQDIEEIQNKIISEKKNYSNKIINLQKKLREYEIKRSTFTANKLKQNANSEKDSDDQDIYIARLKNQIAALEKTNFMLKIDKRDAIKDNDKNLRTRKKNMNMNYGFIPTKSRISTNLKDNKENEYRRSNASMRRWAAGPGIEKKNLFNSGLSGINGQTFKNTIEKKEDEKSDIDNDNNKKDENEDDESNSGSIIDNDNDE